MRHHHVSARLLNNLEGKGLTENSTEARTQQLLGTIVGVRVYVSREKIEKRVEQVK